MWPMTLWAAQMRFSMLAAQSGTVIALRLMGGLPRGEYTRMVAEKPAAFADAMARAGFAAMRGAAGSEVATAWMRPLERKTNANARRLKRHRRRR